jgi:hypothetical protein
MRQRLIFKIKNKWYEGSYIRDTKHLYGAVGYHIVIIADIVYNVTKKEFLKDRTGNGRLPDSVMLQLWSGDEFTNVREIENFRPKNFGRIN